MLQVTLTLSRNDAHLAALALLHHGQDAEERRMYHAARAHYLASAAVFRGYGADADAACALALANDCLEHAHPERPDPRD